MTDREKLIDIKNQIIEHLNQKDEEPIEEPETPTEEEEPIENEPIEESESPISNLTAIKFSPQIVNVTWTAHTDGEMDIEYYRPEIDMLWKHSVKKYVAPIDIRRQAVSIGFNAPVEEALFRAVIDGEVIGQPVRITKTEPIEDEEPIEMPTPEPEIHESEGDVEIAIVFHRGLNIDVWLNEKKVPKEWIFDYMIPNPAGDTLGVKVVRRDVLTTFELDPEQIDLETFAYKFVNRDPDNNLYNINANHTIPTTDWDFWGAPARQNPLGIIVSQKGDTRSNSPDHYPFFYKGFPDDPVNNPDDLSIHQQWSMNKKIVINLGV